MINNNKFFIDSLKTVVFLGHSEKLLELLKINKKLKLKTIIVTSEHQAKLIDKKKIDFVVYNNLTKDFKKFILKNTSVEKTAFMSLGARYIFKKDTIDNFFKNNLVNFHGTRLPLDAGGGGFSWKIMREDRIDNQLVHVVDEGLDSGPIIDNKLSLFPKTCQIPIDFENYRNEKFLEFYSQFIKKLVQRHKFKLIPQTKYIGRYNPRLNTETQGWIDWNIDSYELINFINAFDEPYKGASTYLNNGNLGKLYLKKAQLHGGDSSNHPFMSGIVSRHDGDWIVVSTKSKHMLLIEKVLNSEGKNVLNKIKAGDKFFTPIEELNNSNKKRVIITSSGKKN